jgi:hypothetical protein
MQIGTIGLGGMEFEQGDLDCSTAVINVWRSKSRQGGHGAHERTDQRALVRLPCAIS